MTGRAAADAEAAFRAFYRREFRPVLGLMLSLCRDRDLAEDLAQEAFSRAYRDWHKVSGYDNPEGWIRTVAVNLVRSRHRRLLSKRRALARFWARESTRGPSVLPERDETFWAAVRDLPRQQAIAVALYYVDDRSVAEIAELTGVAEGTVKSHLHRARHTLAEALADQEVTA